jgi:hypothetical protein
VIVLAARGAEVAAHDALAALKWRRTACLD